jgi:hypothetical protein
MHFDINCMHFSGTFRKGIKYPVTSIVQMSMEHMCVELHCSTARFDWFDLSFNLNKNEHYSYTNVENVC